MESINKRQKEIQGKFLEQEKEVLKKLEQSYREALEEINDKIELLLARQDADMQHVIYQVEYQKALKSQVSTILEQLHNNEFETISEYLQKSYEDGFVGTMYDLQGQGIPLIIPLDQTQIVSAIQHETKITTRSDTATGKLYASLYDDINDLKKKIAAEISRGVSRSVMYSEIAKNIALYGKIPKNNAMRIARTEAHRIQIQATADAQRKAKANGADVVKQWDSALDKRTRDSHMELDGQIRELEEEFEVNGHKALHPGGFGVPEEDINCRCALLQRARWNLGHNYTKWDENAPVEIADDGTSQLAIIEAKNYDDFKAKYNKAVEKITFALQNTVEIIEKCKNIKELNKTAFEIFSEYGIDDVDFSGIDIEVAKKNVMQIYDLLSQYKTELKSIETTTSKKYLGNVMRSGTSKNQLETATMQISKKYANKMEQWIEEVEKGVEKGESPRISKENYIIYPLTHEFAHTFGNDYINMFYGFKKNDDFWKEVENLRNEYKKDYSRDKTISLGKYATTNNDEFIAECFAEALLSDSPSKYSMKTKELIDKYFKK